MPFAVLSSVQKNLVNPIAFVPPVPIAFIATGGQMFVTGGYVYHVFTGSGTPFVVASGSATGELLVVGSGGGGKSGGGGAGGAVYSGSYSYSTAPTNIE